MILFHESLDLDPASPQTVDAFVELSEKERTPLAADLGARLVGAFTCNADWFARTHQLFAFDDLEAFAAFRARARDEAGWARCEAEVDRLAPQRGSELLEPLGAVPEATLDAAIAASADSPVGVYSMAELEVRPGRMDDFVGMLAAAAPSLPIVGSWRPVVGHPRRVLDLWSRTMGSEPYRPADDFARSFFPPLREVAPKERITNWTALPHSPLR